MQRINASPTFTDLSLAELGGPRATAFFDRCLQEIPFSTLADAIADLFPENRPGGGAPHCPLLTLVKILFLQKVFGLSDPMTEEMLRDRISFRRFVGLSFEDKNPDHSTLSLFRKRLREHGHGATLFERSLQSLRDKGLTLSNGTLIDASILEAPLGGKRADGSSSADPCASKTAKGGRGYFGYRVHLATDRRGLITDYVYDTAQVSEQTHFDHLARNEATVVYADSGCRSRERLEAFRQRGVTAALCHRRVKGQKELTAPQKRLIRLIAPIRAFVEHPFGWIKQRLNHRRVRYRGLARNALDFALSAMAWNFCRSLTLKPARAVALAA
jgi:IS5 family transposase